MAKLDAYLDEAIPGTPYPDLGSLIKALQD